MNVDEGRSIQANGISLYVEDHGSGEPVLLIHGWPDSAFVWRNQIPFLVANGFRVIAPDMRGLGRSGRPPEVAAYALPNAVAEFLTRSVSRRRTSSGTTSARRWRG
jgi:pimeloyl-ACP methyl ester carboxylesterase